MTAVGDNDYDNAAEIVEQALNRVRRELAAQRAYLVDLTEQIETCRLFLSEAIIAERALANLLAGDLYQPELTKAEIDRIERNEPEPEQDIAPPTTVTVAEEAAPAIAPEPLPERPEAPASLLVEPEPEGAGSVVAFPGSAKRDAEAEALGERIVADLPTLYAEWPGGVPKSVLLKRYETTYYLIDKALAGLRAAGEVQVLHPLDQRGKVVLPAGATLPPPSLSEKQRAVFDALKGSADSGGIARVAKRTLCAEAGVSAGAITAILDAVIRKGYVREIERGVGTKCSAYLVQEPAGAAPSARPVPAPAAPLLPTPSDLVPPARVAQPAAIAFDDTSSVSGPRPWMRRRHGECAWPVSGDGADLVSCCAPCAGATYCETHQAIAYVTRRAK